MKEITEAELEAKFEDYVERCEEGEVFIIKCFDHIFKRICFKICKDH